MPFYHCFEREGISFKKTGGNGGIDDDEADDNTMEDDIVGDDETGLQDEVILREEVIMELQEVEDNAEPGLYPLI
ncbi:hypothetical protein BGX20_008385 [Mortierella sp. AD010]|nr:hypothetical protein BGX20_008385 [Mortierella sp. AD010]